MRHGRPAAGAFALALALGAFAMAPLASAAKPSLDARTQDRLSSALAKEIERQELPGAIVSVKRDGRPAWTIAQGFSNLQSLKPMRVRNHVRIGSITKSFVTSEILLLAQQGRLGLDDPISIYVDGVPGGDQITLRQLADMTSGLNSYTFSEQFSFEYITGETFTPDHLLELGLAEPSLFAPGAEWMYSNTNTILLGKVVETVTGEPLEIALENDVFEPLGLDDTSLPLTPELPRPFAYGYTYQTMNGRLGDATYFTPTATWAAGGAVSDSSDLLRAARFFATGKPLLDPATQRERERWVALPPNSKKQRYGFGVFDFNGWIGHNGGLPGYTTTAWHLPEKRMSLVVAVNSDIHIGPPRPGYSLEPAPEVAHALTRILSPGHVAPQSVRVHE
jgi:D-alanyl-D-alanine carboxypeptidase